jgi:hypothetical protein
MIRACVFALLTGFAAVNAAQADETLYIRIVSAYSKLSTYCDRGEKTTGEKGLPSYFTHFEFERCLHRDGRYRILKRDLEPGEGHLPLSMQVEWWDGAGMSRWSGSPDGKGTVQYYDGMIVEQTGGYGGRLALGELIGEFTEPFNAHPHRSLHEMLLPYQRVESDGEQGFDVYEAKEQYDVKRLWVSRADGLIRRSSIVGTAGAEVSLSEVVVNRPVRAARLTFTPPAGARATQWIDENPGAFFWLLVAASGAMGFAFWFWRARRAASADHWLATRRRAWKTLGIIAVVMVLFAAKFLFSGKPSLSGIFDIQRGIAILGLLVIVAMFFAVGSFISYRESPQAR